MTSERATVAELITALSKYPPDAHVGVDASCCPHLHNPAVRAPTAAEVARDPDVAVVIDANS